MRCTARQPRLRRTTDPPLQHSCSTLSSGHRVYLREKEAKSVSAWHVWTPLIFPDHEMSSISDIFSYYFGSWHHGLYSSFCLIPKRYVGTLSVLWFTSTQHAVLHVKLHLHATCFGTLNLILHCHISCCDKHSPRFLMFHWSSDVIMDDKGSFIWVQWHKWWDSFINFQSMVSFLV